MKRKLKNKILKAFTALNVALVVVGASCADSESLVIPCTFMCVGMLFIIIIGVANSGD